MPKLVLIGGAPGVGKTTVLQHLPAEFDRCACLDADDVWRVHPPMDAAAWRDTALGEIAEGNVVSVLGGYLRADYPFVFLAWVLADPEKSRRILSALEGLYDSALVLHLSAGEDDLAERAREKLARGLSAEYQAFKARQIDALDTIRIDTTNLAPRDVARAIRAQVEMHDG